MFRYNLSTKTSITVVSTIAWLSVYDIQLIWPLKAPLACITSGFTDEDIKFPGFKSPKVYMPWSSQLTTSCTFNNQISAEHPYLPSLNCVCHEAVPNQMTGPDVCWRLQSQHTVAIKLLVRMHCRNTAMLLCRVLRKAYSSRNFNPSM